MTPPESNEFSIFKTRGPLDPVGDSAIYVQRPELDRLLSAARAPTVDAYLAILGSRQTGKTTLLYQLRSRLRPRGLGVALIDLAIVHYQPERQLYGFFASEMRSELAPNLAQAGERRASSGLPTNPVEFRGFLRDMARQVQAPRIVVLIDEVEAVSEKYSDSFFGTIRNVFSSRRKEDEAIFEKYLFILSGAKELHRLTGGPNSPLNIAERIYLQDFDLAGVRALASNFRRAGIHAPDGAAQWIYDQASGHPYLSQKLCSLIERWRPESVTAEIVQRATNETLRGDDHLEKMIIQIDAEPRQSELLRQIVAEGSIPFSRLKPAVARLELIGAIREAGGQCVVRNAIYLAALQAHYNLAGKPTRRARNGIPWGRLALALIAAVIIAINVPFLYVYTTDIVLTSHLVSDQLPLPQMGVNAVVRYDPVLRAGASEPSVVRVEVDHITSTTPVLVTFHRNNLDILLEGDAQRQFRPPFAQERFNFALGENSSGGLSYNPLNPTIEHRRVDLIFEPQSRGNTGYTYAADFRIDYFSAAIISLLVSIAAILTFVAGVSTNLQRIYQAIAAIRKPRSPKQ